MDSCGTILNFYFSRINDRNKLLELNTKWEFGELMYNMTGMGGDMT